jgi:uncharacterized protein (DUF433 family)
MMRSIVCTEGTCGGSPRIDGTRLTCGNVVSDFAYRKVSLVEWLATYPDLKVDDLKSCLEYCSSKRCIDDNPKNYCTGCTLDKREEEVPSAFLQSAEDIGEFAQESGEGHAYLGAMSQYLKERGHISYWEDAKRILESLLRE